MAALQLVRGTQDLLPEAARRHRVVGERAREIASLYGYAEMATPIFEFTEVFERPIGEETDIVQKEMYTFADRGGDRITLRPENTAGVVRAVLSNGLAQQAPLKFFYSGPMFRYERPQKGRLRQFHQFGVELLGVAQPLADVEVIALGYRILGELGLGDRVVLKLNTLGDPASRAAYREALVAYLSAHHAHLSEDSRRRLDRNPLRVLDSKDAGDQQICADAPPFDEFLNVPSRDFFSRVREGLDQVGLAQGADAKLKPIQYDLDQRLVRGLDYYTHTVFEFVTTALGAQGTVLAGGRYDELVALMGGPPMPGVGWAAGIERLAMLIAEPPPPSRPIAVVPVGEAAESAALAIAERLRHSELAVDLGYSGNLGRRMRRAHRVNARAAVLIGEDEIARNVVTVRDLDSGEQGEVRMDPSLGELRTRLRALYGEPGKGMG